MVNANGVRAGSAFVEVSADLTPLQQRLGQIQDRFKNLGSRVRGVGTRIAGVGAAITGVGGAGAAGLAAITKRFASVGDAAQKAAARTGASAEAISSLGFAAEQSGSSFQAINDGLFRLNRRIGLAQSGAGPAAKALEELGLSAQELSSLDTEQRFLRIADALQGVPDEARRSALGFQLFGDSFKSLTPLLAEGSQGIRKLQQEAKELGVAISDDDADAAAKLGDAVNRVQSAVSGITNRIGAALAPAFTRIADITSGIIARISEWIDRNRSIVRTVAAIAGGLGGVGFVLTSIGGLVAAVGLAISGLGTAFGLVSSAIAAVGLPAIGIIAGIGLAVAAVTGGFVFLANRAGLLGPTFDFIKEKISDLFGVFKETFGGIVAALGNGRIQLAGQIAFEGLRLAVLKTGDSILEAFASVWNNAGTILTRFVSAYFRTIVDVAKRVPGLVAAALRGSVNVTKAISDLFSGVGDVGVGGLLDGRIQQSQNRLTQLVERANRPTRQQRQQRQRRQQFPLQRRQQQFQRFQQRAPDFQGRIRAAVQSAQAAAQRVEQQQQFGGRLQQVQQARQAANVTIQGTDIAGRTTRVDSISQLNSAEQQRHQELLGEIRLFRVESRSQGMLT